MKTPLKVAIFSVMLGLILILSSLADHQSAIAQDSESIASEQQVKESIQRVAESVICQNDHLLDSVGIDRQRCEYGISTFSDACWSVLDNWVSDYHLADTPDDEAKYQRIADVYVLCQEAKLLKIWVKRRPENPD